MKFNSLATFGVIFIALGIAGLLHPNIVMPAKKQYLTIAGTQVITETHRVVNIPTVLGVLLIVGGAAAAILSQINPDKRRK